MKLTRMDLDGTGSPMGLVGKILKAEPNLPLPIPIEEIAGRLDITDIEDVTAENFEGGLITDTTRSSGAILVNRTARRGRRRFTIGHELGHFLMTTHKPPSGGFRCSRADMRRWNPKDPSPAAKMEFEANEFSGLLLMPPPLWRREAGKYGDPNLSQVMTLAGVFDVSKEAAARAFAKYHDEAVAIVVSRDRKIDKIYRDIAKFPRLSVSDGDPVPASSALIRTKPQLSHPTGIEEARPEDWLQSDWGKPMPVLFEQVFFQQDGFALIMLWAEVEEDEEDRDEDRTSKQRYQDQQQRKNR